MMQSTYLFVLATTLLAWQDSPPANTPKLNDDEIARAIVELGNDRLAIREAASRRLWEAGRAAEPALKTAAAGIDAEVRLRARSILERFRYGIYPDTPPEVVNLIQEFRNASTDRRAVILQKLAESQRHETVFQLIEAETDPTTRTALLDRFFKDGNNALAVMIGQGQLEHAERLLDTCAATDMGMLAIASFHLTRGSLDARIERTSKDVAEKPLPHTCRLLAYLLRAKGDLAAALRAAREGNDQAMQRALLLENRQWEELARIQRDAGVGLPMPYTTSLVPAANRVEVVGYNLAAASRAGMKDDVEKYVTELKQMAADEKSQSAIQWNVAEALFISGRGAEAIELLKVAQPPAAFELLTYQHRYREAFEFTGLKEGAMINAAWLDALPAPVTSLAAQRYQRFRLALSVARVLHTLGLKERATQVLEVLNRHAQDAGPRDRSSGGRAEFLIQLSQTELRMGLLEPAFAHAEQAVDKDTELPAVLRGLFGNRVEEAMAWQLLLLKSERTLPLAKWLARVHRFLQLSAPAGSDEELQQWLQPAIELAQTMPQIETKSKFVESLASTYFVRNHVDSARKLLEITASQRSSSALRLGDLEAERKAWAEAAKWYQKAVELDPLQPLPVLLAGIALENDGNAEAGQRLQRQARLLSLSSQSRHALGQQLHQRGHTAKARELLEFALRTGPCEHWETNDAARLLGELIDESEPLRAAQLWERHMLADLRVIYNFLDVENYLRFPFLIAKHKAKAAVMAGRFDDAGSLARIAWETSPNDVRLAEELVPLLDRAQQRAEADKLFAETYDSMTRALAEYPNSAFHRNNIAWVAARCRRRLDEALEHARRATELSPESASYFDTLAEVHFQRGNREEAVKHSQRAVALSPRYKPFQTQLQRFQKDPLPQ